MTTVNLIPLPEQTFSSGVRKAQSSLFSSREQPARIEEDNLPLLSDFVEALTGVTQQVGSPEEGVVFTVDNAFVEMPVELDIFVSDGGQVSLGGAPSTQITETSVMPVLHNLGIRVVLEEESRIDNASPNSEQQVSEP